eukprot:4616446-Amphidinium_carterae.1
MVMSDSQWSDSVDAGYAQVFMVEAFSPDFDPSHMSEPVDDGGEDEEDVDAEGDGDDAAAASVARQHGAVA